MPPQKVQRVMGCLNLMGKGMLCFLKKRKESHMNHKRIVYGRAKFIMSHCLYVMEVLAILHILNDEILLIKGRVKLKSIRVK